jgi:hypothetical protein
MAIASAAKLARAGITRVGLDTGALTRMAALLDLISLCPSTTSSTTSSSTSINLSLDEIATIAEGRKLVARLVADEDWLPEAYAQPDPEYYRQYCSMPIRSSGGCLEELLPKQVLQ